MIYRFWTLKIAKQDESNGESKFRVTIGFRGKLASYWKKDRIQFQKWRGVCRAYNNPILEYHVREMNFDNIGKACGAQIIFTTRSGMVGREDLGFSEKNIILNDDVHGERCSWLFI